MFMKAQPMQFFVETRRTLLLSIVLILVAQISNADAFIAAQKELETLKSNCYPDIDTESVAAPEISIEGVLSEILIGHKGNTTAYVINPQNLVCDGKSAGLCGTRGCEISIFAEDYKFVYTGWQPEIVIYEDIHLILLTQSGWACGTQVNAVPCFSVVSWDDDGKGFVYNLWRGQP